MRASIELALGLVGLDPVSMGMGTIRARDAAALLGYGFLGLDGFSFWVLSSVGKVFGMFLGWFLFLLPSTPRARRPACRLMLREERAG
jgi:hypothetical protein